jgi:hypothetical protein
MISAAETLPRRVSGTLWKRCAVSKNHGKEFHHMAIYHLEAKIISRGTGRSAVAAAAYMGCDVITNEYDGITHDYTRKGGLVWEHIFLPAQAPPEWSDRGTLWNAVERSEKAKDSRLARELIAALPLEIPAEEWKAILTDYVMEHFVSDGMCADVAIHDTDGHNPHAHILLTVRPLNQDGTWQYKTQKEYLCVRNGEERGFTAQEFLQALRDGWEKQYPYKKDGKKVFLPPSKAIGLERLSKQPKSTTYGRQNPITARWNSKEQLEAWRSEWAGVVNRYLEKSQQPERIDHRSFADQGIDLKPTIHEGVTARVLESKGIVSDRCELNQQIKADNALIRKLKELLSVVKDVIQVFAEKLESIRDTLVETFYGQRQATAAHKYYWNQYATATDRLDRLEALLPELKAKVAEQKRVHKELESTGKIHFKKRKELAERDAVLIEEINELQNERSMLMQKLNLTDEKQISNKRASIQPLEPEADRQYELSQDFFVQHAQAKKDYDAVEEESVEQNIDRRELWQRQQAIRLENTPRLHDRLKAQYGKDFDENGFDDAVREMRYYTQARHYAVSDYAKRLQREKLREVRNGTQKPCKKHNEPER